MRWLTALAIICICGVTVAWGWQATQFAQSRATVMDGRASNASLAPWIGVPGLSAEALEVSLRRPSAAALPPVLREAQLSALIAAHPMSAQAWLSLAGERLVLGRPAARIDAAVTMSWVTGPNEGSVMWQRGMFALLRWEVLSPEAKREAIADLAGAMEGGASNGSGESIAKSIVQNKSLETRTEIVNSLRIAGLSPSELGRIGLKIDSSSE